MDMLRSERAAGHHMLVRRFNQQSIETCCDRIAFFEKGMLAFIISGSATSAWVIAGLTTFMRKRALALYVGYILAGSILAGYVYDLFLRFA